MNLKDNIFIEGFATQTGVDLELLSDKKKFLRCDILGEFNSNLLYEGKTSDIPEELARECVDWTFWDETPERRRYYNYGKKIGVSFPYLNAKESILSDCDTPYCIIYKINY